MIAPTPTLGLVAQAHDQLHKSNVASCHELLHKAMGLDNSVGTLAAGHLTHQHHDTTQDHAR